MKKTETDMWVERVDALASARDEAAHRLSLNASVTINAFRALEGETDTGVGSHLLRQLAPYVDAYDEAVKAHWTVLMER